MCCLRSLLNAASARWAALGAILAVCIEDIHVRSKGSVHSQAWQRSLDHADKPSGGLIQAQGASEVCGTQDQAHLSGVPLLQIVFASSKLFTIAREWHRRHCPPKKWRSGPVTPRCSQPGNRTRSHHSHTSTHYTVKQKYLYFPGWLQWFLVPLSLNHVLFYYLRKTPSSCRAGTATWDGFVSATPCAVMGSSVCLRCLGKACCGHCGPHLFSISLSLMNVNLGPSPLAESRCAGDLKRAGTTPMS